MTTAEKKPILGGLIVNGIRHLTRGLGGFESDELDFAVTDTFFGFEIILKALVFQNEWEQIFVDPSEADALRLQNGECRTIGRAESIKRLKTFGINLPKAVTHFKILEQHRNKLVHYFHPDLVTAGRRRRIASELANGWGALRAMRALPQIADSLAEHNAAFGRLETRLLVLDRYLNEQALAVRAAHAHPDCLSECPACKRQTFDGDCALCGYSEPSHREITQGAEGIGPADCPTCGALGSVVISGTEARCTESDCAAWFEGIHCCEFCQEPFVVEDEREVIDDEDHAGVGSFQIGCPNCSGNLGYQMSKDD
jgi:hypothetical protein